MLMLHFVIIVNFTLSTMEMHVMYVLQDPKCSSLYSMLQWMWYGDVVELRVVRLLQQHPARFPQLPAPVTRAALGERLRLACLPQVPRQVCQR